MTNPEIEIIATGLGFPKGPIALPAGCDGRKLNGPKDPVFDGDGGFYFVDTGRVREFVRDHGTSTVERRRLPNTRIAFPVMTPNGIGLSPDNRTLYEAEMETARLWAFPIMAPGVVSKLPCPSPHRGTLVVGPGGYQRLDSLRVAASGNICRTTRRRLHHDSRA